MMKRYLFILMFLVALTTVNSQTIYVDSTGSCVSSPCYTSIQAAINASSPGGTIVIAAQHFQENLSITKNLTFRGEQTGVNGNAPGRASSAETHLTVPASGALLTLTPGVTVTFDGVEILGNGENVLTFNSTTATNLTITNSIIKGLTYQSASQNIYWKSTGGTFSLTNSRLQADGNGGVNTGNKSTVFLSGGNATITNNSFTSAAGSPGVERPVIFNVTGVTATATFTGNTFDDIEIGILIASQAANVSILNNTFNNANNPVTANKGSGVVFYQQVISTSNISIQNNIFSNSQTAIRTSEDTPGSYTFPTNTKIKYNKFDNITGKVFLLGSSFGGSLDARCNYYGSGGPDPSAFSAPTVSVKYKNWLGYDDADNGSAGFQTPTSFTVTSTGNTSDINNDYRILSNAVGCAISGQTITLNGSFNYNNTYALADFNVGNDGDVSATDDNYGILVPIGLDNIHLTGINNATINGPQDLAGANLEAFLYFDFGTNRNWEIDHLTISGFDLGIGFLTTTGLNSNRGTKIHDNIFNIPKDLNVTEAPDDANQNIGIHLANGTNQQVYNNTFYIDGTGVSDGVNKSSSVALQSHTTGANNKYDSLAIYGNHIHVTGQPDGSDPAYIIGIWENSHNKNSGIEIYNNTFVNDDTGNTPATNKQLAFRLTSRSGSSRQVRYHHNEISGFNRAIDWIGDPFGSYPAANYEADATPTLVENNKIDNVQYGVTVRKNVSSPNAGAPGTVKNNSFTNLTGGGHAIAYQETGTVDGKCNWYGTLDYDVISAAVIGNVDRSLWLSNGGNSASTGFDPTGVCQNRVHNVTKNIWYETINAAIAAAATGDSLFATAGDYYEDVNVNKTNLKLSGVLNATDTTRIIGSKSSGSTTLNIGGSGAIVSNLAVTRDGNDTASWATNAKTIGVGFQGTSGSRTARNLYIYGNRNGIDINNAQNITIENCNIDFNRTGIILRNNDNGTVIRNNRITNNWTLGVLFLQASGTTSGISVTNNNISGNWYSQVENRQTDSTNLNFESNWWGNATLNVTADNSAEPGYTDQIPVAYGGTASSADGTHYTISGANGRIDYSPWLGLGTNNAPSGSQGFVPVYSSVYVSAASPKNVSSEAVLGSGITLAAATGTVHVLPGTYNEKVNISKSLTLVSTGGKEVTNLTSLSPSNTATVVVGNTTDVTIGQENAGFTIQGVDNATAGVESAAIYLNGTLTNIHIGHNTITANGEAAVLTSVSGIKRNIDINNNLIDGKTYTGATPFDGTLYSNVNTSKSAIVLNSNGKNVHFTDNTVTAITGEGNVRGNVILQSGTDTLEISGNTFAGKVADSWNNYTLRIRGTQATITCNDFSQSETGNYLYTDVIPPYNVNTVGANNTFHNPKGLIDGDTIKGSVDGNLFSGLSAITGDSSVCAGSAITLDGGFPGGVWSSGNESIATIDSEGHLTGVSAGDVEITYTYTQEAGCSFETHRDFTVHPTTGSIGAISTEVCQGLSAYLTSSGGVSYAWSGPDGFTSTEQNPVVANMQAAKTGVYSVTVTNEFGCIYTGTLQLSLKSGDTFDPHASVASDTVCTLGTIQFTASGADTYQWTGPNGFTSTLASPQITNATVANQGTYQLAAASASGCIVAFSFNVHVNYVPNAHGQATSPGCGQSTGSITVLSPIDSQYTYAIDGVHYQSSTAFTGLIPGTYHLTAKDPSGCISLSETIEISATPAYPALTSDISPAYTRCEGAVINFNTTSNAPIELKLNGNVVDSYGTGTHNISYTVASTGLFEIVATSGQGCQTTVSSSITVNPRPQIPVDSTVNPGCGQTLGKIIVTTPVGSGLSYSLNGGTFQSGVTFNALTPGTYLIRVKNNNGCISFEDTSVVSTPPPSPTPSATATGSRCVGSSIQLETPSDPNASTYNWAGPDGFTSSLRVATVSGLTVGKSGVYTVTVVNTYGCSATSSVSITVNSLPVASASAINTTLCTGATLYLQSSGGATYQWSGPASFSSTQQNPTRVTAVGQGGSYTVTVTSGAGCSASSAVAISLNALPTGYAAAVATSVCEGKVLSLKVNDGETGETYQWVGPNSYSSTTKNPSLANIGLENAGTYILQVTRTSTGCYKTSNVAITVNPKPVPGAIQHQFGVPSAGNLTLTVNSGYHSYKWSPTPNDTTHPSAVYLTPTNGTYRVTVTTDMGCTATATKTISVPAMTSDVTRELASVTTNTDVRSMEDENAVSDRLAVVLSPIPMKEFVRLTFEEPLPADVVFHVQSIDGRVVRSSRIAKGSVNWEMRRDNLVSGSYFYTIISTDGQVVSQGKIIVIE